MAARVRPVNLALRAGAAAVAARRALAARPATGAAARPATEAAAKPAKERVAWVPPEELAPGALEGAPPPPLW